MLNFIRMVFVILGWALLILLGLLIALVMLALFVPVPYRIWIAGKPGTEPVYELRVSIFGLQVYPKKTRCRLFHKKPKEKSKEDPLRKEADTGPQQTDTAAEQMSASSKKLQDAAGSAKDTSPAAENVQVKAKKTSRSVSERMQPLKQLWAQLTDERNRQAFLHVLGEIRYILRHFGPRRVHADAVYSLGDPQNTGYVTAGLSLCPFVYGRHCAITPDFESAHMYIDGWVELGGHIRLVHVAAAGCRLLLDKNIRRLLKTIRK